MWIYEHLPGGKAAISLGENTPQGQGIRQICLTASLVATLLLGYVPGLRVLTDGFRRFSHFVALYPQAIQLILTVMARSAFRHNVSYGDVAQQELMRYSVPAEMLDRALSPNAVRLLQEVCSLRRRFDELSAVSDYASFLNARKSSIKMNELELQTIVRRVAKALVTATSPGEGHFRVVSQFVSEDCQDLILKYRNLIAEASVACIPAVPAREHFLKSFGYQATLPPLLPYLPLIVVFGLDSVLLLWPLMLSPWFGLDWMPLSPHRVTAFAIAHAMSLTGALAWAIFPKLSFKPTRSSLDRFAWDRYLLFGCLTYLTSVLVWTALRLLIEPIPGMPLATHPVLMIALSSCPFLVMNVCISVLLDIRLRKSVDEKEGRWRDGMITGLFVTLTAVITQLFIMPLIPTSIIPRPWELFALYVLVTFLESSVLGFFLPSVASAHLKVDEQIGKQVITEADILARFKQRRADLRSGVSAAL
jgi:hypothetical protein